MFFTTIVLVRDGQTRRNYILLTQSAFFPAGIFELYEFQLAAE